MTHRERFISTLLGRPVDHVPFIKLFGGANAVLPQWEQEYPGIGGCIDLVLQFEGPYRGWLPAPISVEKLHVGEPEVTRRADGYLLYTWRDGTRKIVLPESDFHTQSIAWPVKTLDDWERLKADHLDSRDPERYPAEWETLAHAYAARDYPLALYHGGVYGFARNVMGDENLALAFYDDPELVHSIMDDYTDFTLRTWQRAVENVQFDLVEFWEDMASKNGALISPTTFREFMAPNYRKVAAFAREQGIPILLADSDGFIEELSGLMMEAGVNALYPFEVGAGNDVTGTLDRYPGLAALGGLEKDVMAQGKAAIDAEMEKARRLIAHGRCIPGPDHFALSNVTFAHYRYFMESLREVVLQTTPQPIDAMQPKL